MNVSEDNVYDTLRCTSSADFEDPFFKFVEESSRPWNGVATPYPRAINLNPPSDDRANSQLESQFTKNTDSQITRLSDEKKLLEVPYFCLRKSTLSSQYPVNDRHYNQMPMSQYDIPWKTRSNDLTPLQQDSVEDNTRAAEAKLRELKERHRRTMPTGQSKQQIIRK